MPSNPPNNGKKIAGIDTKWWLIGGGGAVIIVWYSMRKAKASVPAPAADPTQGGTIDPATGMPYDQEYAAIAGGAIGNGGAFGGMPGVNTVAQAVPVASTNTDWYQAGVNALESHGYTAAAASSALGEYLLGLPLTPDQRATVEAAVALVGPPPNFIGAHLIPKAGGPGLRGILNRVPVPAPHLTAVQIAGRKVQATATPVARATGYQWDYGAGVPTAITKGHVHTSASYPPGHHYGPLKVRAYVGARPGAWSNPVTVVIH